MSYEYREAPLSPEASLRECVDDIVMMFAEPVAWQMHPRVMQVGQKELLVPDHLDVSPDTKAELVVGSVGVQIMTQEAADPDLDQQLPHAIMLRARHKLGDVFVHASLPMHRDPSLVPSELQDSRPMITTVVASNVRSSFDRNMMLNELLRDRTDPREQDFLQAMLELVRPVRTRDGDFQPMSEQQMQILEQCLGTLFWPGQERSEGIGVGLSGKKIYAALVSGLVRLRYGA